MAGGGVVVWQNQQAKKKRPPPPPPREYTGKKLPPLHDTAGKFLHPSFHVLKTCLYVAVVLLQELKYM